MVVSRSDVRWVDAQSDLLSRSYFDKFGDKYLDAKWARVLAIPVEEPGPIVIDLPGLIRGAHATRVTRSWAEGDLSLRAPSSATWTETGQIARFELGAGSSIHVYSTPAVGKAPATQLEWVEQAITKLAGEGKF